MKSVIEMIRAELVGMGADGLANEDSECGCSLDDLIPCGNVHETECFAAKNNKRKAKKESLDFWMERIE
jgi:hypothetical protein